MMKRLLTFISLMSFFIGAAFSEELLSASRWDLSIKPYKYEFQGELVRSISDYRTAVNQTGIQPSRDRQIRAEESRLEQLLKSRGYYEAVISSAWDEKKNKPKYQILLGDRYSVASITIDGNFQPQDDQWEILRSGDPLSAVLVVGQQSKLRKYIEERTCYYNASVDHRVELHRETRSADIQFLTQVSEPATFGQVSFVGAGDVDPDFLWRVTGIRDGECYKRVGIDNAVISLFDTGLFSQVRPDFGRDSAGKVIVNFVLEKRKKRTLSSSIGWKSEQGFGGAVGWQHRDLLGKAQSLALGLELQSSKQTASAKVVVPSFLDRRNRLNWENIIEHSDINDLDSTVYSSTARLERKASRQDYFEYGIGYSQTDEQRDNEWSTFRQIRVPLKYQFDSVFNPFNPSTGLRTLLEVEPVLDIDEFTPFILTGVGLQHFSPVDSKVTLASRIKWDSLWYGGGLESSLESIPDTEWLTAGGSTSIRGYEYQSIKITPDKEGSTTTKAGATQRWLMVNELRMRVNDSWGLVGFWDVGTVSNSLNPLQQDNWFNGAGLGVRYFTRFAPIRFDVAFPLNKRESDSAFLVYVSLGQAF